MYIGDEGSPTVVACTFRQNSASVGAGLCNTNGSPTVEGCGFYDNVATTDGGGVATLDGSYPTFLHCTFGGNDAMRGGGMHSRLCTPTLSHCRFCANTAFFGAALDNLDVSMLLSNCTISANEALIVGGVNCSSISDLDASNCILWNNADYGGTGETAQLMGGTLNINYSCVQGWTGGLGGAGNFDLDPLWVDPDGMDDVAGTLDDDVHLLPNSPCIDTGDPASEFGFEPEPDGGRVNMGAYGNTPEAATRGWLYITGYEQVSKRRVGRTTFEYELNLTMTNRSSSDVANVLAELLEVPANVEIITNQVSVGDPRGRRNGDYRGYVHDPRGARADDRPVLDQLAGRVHPRRPE